MAEPLSVFLFLDVVLKELLLKFHPRFGAINKGSFEPPASFTDLKSLHSKTSPITDIDSTRTCNWSPQSFSPIVMFFQILQDLSAGNPANAQVSRCTSDKPSNSSCVKVAARSSYFS